jgi:hypothetical protein
MFITMPVLPHSGHRVSLLIMGNSFAIASRLARAFWSLIELEVSRSLSCNSGDTLRALACESFFLVKALTPGTAPATALEASAEGAPPPRAVRSWRFGREVAVAAQPLTVQN